MYIHILTSTGFVWIHKANELEFQIYAFARERIHYNTHCINELLFVKKINPKNVGRWSFILYLCVCLCVSP